MFYYVYMHLDPRTEEVRYVGAGSKSRGFDWVGRSGEHLAWIAELDAADLEPSVVFPARLRDRAEAFYVEQHLIDWHRSRGADLFNVTGGGMGCRGVARTEAQKSHLRSVHQAKWLFDTEFRQKRLPDLAKARAMRNRSLEHRAKITKHPKIEGTPCGKCGGTLRYRTSRNCVGCAKVD